MQFIVLRWPAYSVKQLIMVTLLLTIWVFMLTNVILIVSDVTKVPDYSIHNELVKNKFLDFYTRTSWWDSLLCRNKQSNNHLRNLSDIIPLKTLFKEVWPQKSYSQNIFMIETNCETSIPFYVLCGAESAAKQNPRATVHLLTVTPFLEDPLRIVRNLLNNLPNLVILQMDFDIVLKDTSANGFRFRKLWNSETAFLNAHVSDVVRVALLWKAGGTYSDSDIIYTKELPSNENAIIVFENGAAVNGFLKFKNYHNFLQDLMSFMKISYDGENYISVGPYAIGETIKLHCPLRSKLKPQNATCGNIHFLNDRSLLPIPWHTAEILTESNPTVNTSELLQGSFGIHTNHFVLGDDLNVPKIGSIYNKLTMEFCPNTYFVNLNNKEFKSRSKKT